MSKTWQLIAVKGFGWHFEGPPTLRCPQWTILMRCGRVVIRLTTNTMRYEKLLEAVPDALVGMDQKGTIRFVNRQTEMLFG